MVLAAGLGARMRPLTDARPKPLIAVAGKTLLDHSLDRLAEAGVTRAIVNVHYLPEQIEAHLATRAGAPQIEISDERALLLETGGALVKAAARLGADPIYVTNTDQVFIEEGQPALAMLTERFDPLAMDALLLLTRREFASGYAGPGDFFLAADGRLGRRGSAEAAPFVFTGVQILHPRALAGFVEEPFSLNRVWDRSLSRARLFGAVLEGTWMHVGDPEGLAAAQARLAPSR